MSSNTLAKIGFEYVAEMRDINGKLLWREQFPNLMPLQGINYILDCSMGSASKISGFYMGLFEGDYTPQLTDTGATVAALATECTAYSATTRIAFTPTAANAASISNTGQEAQFTFTADKTVFGAFISSGQSKGSTLGILLSAARFFSPQVGHTGNVLKLAGGCTLANI